ncbi:PQQ-dependent sugar dehydrogenase [Phytohabitans sp. LJ34]|uniref:PQQ-dependent sugar dehydrogenase n=1 Tax=Phytohabitans sp. LJ34 TaxID=3452217 RepID=UPI003F8914DE
MFRSRWLAGLTVLAATVPLAAAAPAQAAIPLDQITVNTTQVAFGLQRPTAIAGIDNGRLLITEKLGIVRLYDPTTGLAAAPVLDIRSKIDTSGNERGLLGIATAPDFATSQNLYVAYTALPDGTLTLSRVRLGDPASEQVILTQAHSEFSNHNGGEVKFGGDGYLYWSLGDGGAADDPLASGQNLGTLLGKIVRLDVSRTCGTQAYCVPADNPFVGRAGARPEIWTWGLRNPWRFSFDTRAGGDNSLWIADVGQGTWEEVNHLDAAQGGANLGWSCREGRVVFNAERCVGGETYVDPTLVYQTSAEGCAVIGGFVYRGAQFADIAGGTYFATDYCSATFWGIRKLADGSHQTQKLNTPDIVQPTSLGVDSNGELYLVNDLPGQLHKISFGQVTPPAPCRVTYETQVWGTGFRATVKVTNTGPLPINGWTVGWTFSGPQRVGSSWNATITQSGAAVSAKNPGWNGTIAPGATAEFGFLGTPGGAQPAPAAFTLNGNTCG